MAWICFRSLSFYSICVHASQRLHDNMFKGLISTSMRFFDTNPSGRILNRFSKDMGATDEFLPKAVLDATQIIFNMFGSIIVTTIVNPWFILPIAILGLVFMGVRKVYLKTSKNIKRMDGTSKLRCLPKIRKVHPVIRSNLFFEFYSPFARLYASVCHPQWSIHHSGV